MPYGTSTITGTGNTWTLWVQSAINCGTGSVTYAGTATATTTGSAIWTLWTTGNATNSAVTTGAATIVWDNWNRAQAVNIPGHAIHRNIPQAARPIVTPEERARREAENALLQAKYEEERRFRIEAEAKAEILLQRLLTAEQRETLKEKRCFFLYSQGKKYRVDRGQHGNVKLLDAKDQVVQSYCIQPKGGIPDADAMAAQKVLLETDPKMFERIANITRRDGTYRRGQPMAAAVG